MCVSLLEFQAFCSERRRSAKKALRRMESIDPVTIESIISSVTIAMGVGMKRASIIFDAMSAALSTKVPGAAPARSATLCIWLNTKSGSIHFMYITRAAPAIRVPQKNITTPCIHSIGNEADGPRSRSKDLMKRNMTAGTSTIMAIDRSDRTGSVWAKIEAKNIAER